MTVQVCWGLEYADCPVYIFHEIIAKPFVYMSRYEMYRSYFINIQYFITFIRLSWKRELFQTWSGVTFLQKAI